MVEPGNVVVEPGNVVVEPGNEVVVVVEPGNVVVEPGNEVVVVVEPGNEVVVVVEPGNEVVVVEPGNVVVEPGNVVVEPGNEVVVEGGVRSQVGWRKVSVSRVTAALRARARPWTVTPAETVMELRARMLPVKSEFVPSVAELPTCQKTLQACAPLMRVMVLLEAVMSVESVWKMKTEVGSPAPSRVRGPERLRGDLLGPA